MKSKAEILAQVELPTITVTVPEWGGDVRIRSMSALERYQWEQDYAKLGHAQDDKSSLPAWLIVHTVVNEDGSLAFSPEDYAEVNKQPAQIVSALFDAACELNRLTKKDREELVKN